MKAYIVLTKGKINRPCDSGLVTVEGEIRLPATPDGQLVDALVFGSSLRLLGETLFTGWGYFDEESGCRTRSFKVSGDTFPNTMKLAIATAKEYLKPLQQALAKRKEKLEKIGEFKPKEVVVNL